MRRLIFLKLDLAHVPNNVSKTKLKEHEKVAAPKAVKEFLTIVKKNKDITVVKELLPEPQVMIEFSDDLRQQMYEYLSSLPVVSLIDPHVPQK